MDVSILSGPCLCDADCGRLYCRIRSQGRIHLLGLDPQRNAENYYCNEITVRGTLLSIRSGLGCYIFQFNLRVFPVRGKNRIVPSVSTVPLHASSSKDTS